MDYVYRYTRKQALEDGVLIDISKYGKQIGFKYPMAITIRLYHEVFVKNDELDEKKLSIVLFQFIHKILLRTDGGDLLKDIIKDREGYDVEVWLMCHGGDDGEPVMTLMYPSDY